MEVEIKITNDNGKSIESYYRFNNLNKSMDEVIKEIHKHGLRELVEEESRC